VTRFLLNPERSTASGPEPSRAALDFHRRLPGYAPTPLRRLPALAEELGVAEIRLKDESQRLGLPAFKILGASWAALRILEQALGEDLSTLELDALRERLHPLRPATFVAATDGNHGRAVAHMAALLGFDARIFVPVGTDRPRIEAIAGEGAEVVEVGNSYERTLEHATAAAAGPQCFLVQDVSWPGFEEVPAWVVEGYATMFWEALEQEAEPQLAPSDLVLVPIGCGMLASAVIAHFRRPGAPPTRIVGVEPESAACAMAALEVGGVVEIECLHTSKMAGLNCGRIATSAWPLLRTGLDAAVAIDEERCGQAVRLLAQHDVAAGECGAAGLGALLALLRDEGADELRRVLSLDSSARILLLSTEGVTHPAGYEEWFS